MFKNEKVVPIDAKPGDKIEIDGQKYVVVRVRTGMLGLEPNKPLKTEEDKTKLTYTESNAPKLGRN